MILNKKNIQKINPNIEIPLYDINKINLGASLVQVYTGWIYEGPSMISRINKALLKKEKMNI